MKLIVYGCTDKGQVRERNEDSYYIPGWPGKAQPGAPECFNTQECIFLAVADGMGGHAGGDVASKIVVEEFDKGLQNLLEENTDHLQKARDLIAAAHQAILESAHANPELYGMGSTICALLFKDDYVTPLHVGDSRAYLCRNGILGQLTKDHSEIQVLLELGLIVPGEAKNHPRKGVILKNLGSEPRYGKFEVEKSGTFNICEGDIFLICSDGLTDMLDDSEIREIIEETTGENLFNLSQKAGKLIEEANNKGGFDNITVVLAAVAKEPEAKAYIEPVSDNQEEGISDKDEDTGRYRQTREKAVSDNSPEQFPAGRNVPGETLKPKENTGVQVKISYVSKSEGRIQGAATSKSATSGKKVKQ